MSSPKKTVYFYSPVPPLRSGTAHYFELLMTQVRELDLTEYDVVAVIDKKFYDKTVFDNPPYTIIDYRMVKRRKEDISIYFLANNEFHRYIHRSLYDHHTDDGMAVSVVHEPCMWMNVQAMCNLREYGFTEDDLPYFAQYEFGDHTDLVCDLFRRGATDKNFEYSSLAGTHIYEHSDVVVFHSEFALQKFTLERSETYKTKRTAAPKYLVMQHPPEEMLQHVPERKHKEKFVAGTYGWAKSVKQTEAIISGFDEFYAALPDGDKDAAILHVVGEVDSERGFDPIGLASSSKARNNIEFYGYVTDQKLDELMAESSLVFSLRFPSCGETSGPLYKANALGVPVVLSDYAAFAEEPASYHVPVEKTLQQKAIVNILHKEFDGFKKGKVRHVVKHKPAGMTIGQVLDSVLNDWR